MEFLRLFTRGAVVLVLLAVAERTPTSEALNNGLALTPPSMFGRDWEHVDERERERERGGGGREGGECVFVCVCVGGGG